MAKQCHVGGLLSLLSMEGCPRCVSSRAAPGRPDVKNYKGDALQLAHLLQSSRQGQPAGALGHLLHLTNMTLMVLPCWWILGTAAGSPIGGLPASEPGCGAGIPSCAETHAPRQVSPGWQASEAVARV